MFDLTSKRAVITGASGGIGDAIARALHQAGATVVLSGTRTDTLGKLAGELGGRAHVISCNLSDPDGPNQLVAASDAALGGIDILINNAGLTRDSLAMRMKDEDWQAVLDVNLSATFRLSRACLKGMMKQRWGRIVGITSVVGVTGNAGQTNYAASKAGMIGMSKALAQEVASRGITVNCVAPGFIVTTMTDALSDGQRQAVLKSVPAGRFGEPRDIAASVAYLASEEASYMTGQTLHVNGGMAMI